MKLILTQEVAGLGAPGDIVEVRDGYGRNYLIPRGYAIRWTKGGEKQINTIRRAREVREIQDLDHAAQVKGQLEELRVTLAMPAGEQGRLYGSVTTNAIVDAVRAAGGPVIDKRRIEVRTPIKTVGAHQIAVKLHQDMSAMLTLDVVPAP